MKFGVLRVKFCSWSWCVGFGVWGVASSIWSLGHPKLAPLTVIPKSYLEGQGDFVNRLIMGISGVTI